jgi:hypothetical protein
MRRAASCSTRPLTCGVRRQLDSASSVESAGVHVSRWRWLRERDQRLKSGTLEELTADIFYCRERGDRSKLKSQIKTWEQRRAEAEAAVIERFGEKALDAFEGGSRAWGKK